MGQGSSKVVVHVQLDGTYYYSGDTVTGAVVVHLAQPIQVKGITAKITGVEKTKWLERRQSSTPAHDVTYEGKHVVFKHQLPLTGPGTIQPGDYQWPLSFTLPHNIPGTFHYQAPDRRAKASIEYKIKAVVDQEGFFKSDFKKTLRFDVLQRTKAAAPTGPLQLSKDVPISSWCCFNKGHMAVSLATDTNSYLPGQAINVYAQVDNKSSTPISLVEVKLHQRLHLMGESFLGTINKYIDVVHVISRQQAVNGTGGAPGLLSQYQTRLDLPRTVEATCLAQVIKSTYELEVLAKTGCCLSEAKLKQPIVINDPQPQAPPPPAVVPPPGWTPQVYPTVTFNVPPPDCYTSWSQPPASDLAAAQHHMQPPAYPTYEPQQQHMQGPPQWQQPQLGYPQHLPGAYAAPSTPQYELNNQQQYVPEQQSGAYQQQGVFSQQGAAYSAGQVPPAAGAVCYIKHQDQAAAGADKASAGYYGSGNPAVGGVVPSYGLGAAAGAPPSAPGWGVGSA